LQQVEAGNRRPRQKGNVVNQNDDEDEEYLTIQEAAALLRVPVATLRYWRSQGVGPPTRKFGRHVRCPKRALLRWADGQGRSGDEHAADGHRRAPTRVV
jgi:excisionase family DNA binding protein